MMPSMKKNKLLTDVCAKYLNSQFDASRKWMLTHDMNEIVSLKFTAYLMTLYYAMLCIDS
jgi:hypothetical protein